MLAAQAANAEGLLIKNARIVGGHSRTRHVLIDGREFALTSRATRLRDRYRQRLNRGQ